jgi:hypothetical protein
MKVSLSVRTTHGLSTASISNQDQQELAVEKASFSTRTKTYRELKQQLTLMGI